MSHVTTITNMKILSKEAIKGAVRMLNEGTIEGLGIIKCKYLENATQRSYHNRKNCDIVIQVEGESWDLALDYDKKKKCYNLSFDTWNGTIQKAFAFDVDAHSDRRMRGVRRDVAKFLAAYTASALKERQEQEEYEAEFEAYIDADNKLQVIFEAA